MRVGTRLYLAVVPAVLGVILVAALGYWGERGRQAPEVMVLVALVAAVTSLVVAWRNTRYVALRIALLAQSRATPGRTNTGSPPEPGVIDELDEIEAAVSGLTTKLAAERTARERLADAAEAKAAEYAEQLDDTVKQLSARLDEAHLPLHILLSSPFGSLNENQEEMLMAAQQAIETADTELRRIRKLIDIDRGDARLVPEAISVRELLRPSLAIAESRGLDRAVRVIDDVPDALPRVVVDPVHTQEAITSLLCDSIARVEPGGELRVNATGGESRRVVVTITPSEPSERESLELRLARRVIAREGGEVLDRDRTRHVRLPAEST